MTDGQMLSSRNYTQIENTRGSTMAVYNYTVDASLPDDGFDEGMLNLLANQIILDL